MSSSRAFGISSSGYARPEPGWAPVGSAKSKSSVRDVADRASLVFRLGFCGLNGKTIRGGVGYEGHGAGPRFDPASAPLGAGASRRIEQGMALTRRLPFLARLHGGTRFAPGLSGGAYLNTAFPHSTCSAVGQLRLGAMGNSEEDVLSRLWAMNICPQCGKKIPEGTRVGSGRRSEGGFCSLKCYGDFYGLEMVERAKRAALLAARGQN
jgi:hypothetical protein